jgi:hypothetical protein
MWENRSLKIRAMKKLSIFIYVLITVFTLATSIHAAGSNGNTTIQSFNKAKKIMIKGARI